MPKKKTTPASSARPPTKPGRPLLRAALAVSLDGYIADRKGGVEWLNPYFSNEIDFMGFTKSIGITVCGRKTFDISLSQGHSGGGRAVVLTHRLLKKPAPGTEAFSGDVCELTDRLRAELAGTGKDIWLMGGGESIAPFHAAGLVDRWELGIIPVLLGDGIPLFSKNSRPQQGLRLTHSRILTNGIVEAWYESTAPSARA
jgi:dihydrofolate reductase